MMLSPFPNVILKQRTVARCHHWSESPLPFKNWPNRTFRCSNLISLSQQSHGTKVKLIVGVRGTIFFIGSKNTISILLLPICSLNRCVWFPCKLNISMCKKGIDDIINANFCKSHNLCGYLVHSIELLCKRVDPVTRKFCVRELVIIWRVAVDR